MKTFMYTLATCALLNSSASANKNEPGEGLKIDQARQVCIGRFVVDIPEMLSLSAMDTLLGNFSIENLGAATTDQINTLVAERQHLMERGGPIDPARQQLQQASPEPPMRDANFQRAETRNGATMLVYDFADPYDSEYIPSAHTIELYTLSQGHLFVFTGQANKSDFVNASENLFLAAEKITPRTAYEAPHEEGLCLQNAFIQGPPIFENEQVTAVFRDEYSTSLSLILETQEGTEMYPERRFNWPSQTSRRWVADVDGTQMLGVMKTPNDASSSYRLWYYAYLSAHAGKAGRELHFRLERLGSPENPHLPREVVYQLWQTVLNSFRVKKRVSRNTLHLRSFRLSSLRARWEAAEQRKSR